MVELDKIYNPDLSGNEIDEDLEKSLPLPIYDAYEILQKNNDYEKSLQILCLSLIPWTFQYLALILSGEYLASDEKPDFEVTDSLLGMVKKPGPGKWLSFIRVATRYFTTHKTQVIPEETIAQLNRIIASEKQPLVKFPDNESKLEYHNALINIRNRFAHSRIISSEKAMELSNDYFLVWKAWVILIKDIFDVRILYKSSPLLPFQPFDHNSSDLKDTPADHQGSPVILWNQVTRKSIRLYPVIVTFSEVTGSSADLAFLEEIRSRYLFYLQGENFFKLKDEFFILSEMIESKMTVDEVTSAENLTLNTFFERIERITCHTITGFTDSLKFIPDMYVDRPLFSSKLDTWLESDLPGCIVTGDPGTGKTSLLTNWCIRRRESGDHILLMEASGLKESDISAIIENELSLGSPLKECLDSIWKQSTDGEKGKSNRLIIVIDAVNEFVGNKNENRNKLWREINSLINILNLYRPTVKCLVTTRNDLWSTDFPGKNTVYDVLKEKLYWTDGHVGFPRINLASFTLEEAEDIFEKTRNKIPGMMVRTPFAKLSDRTKRLLCNPFLMRLALILYNEKEVTTLTRSKLEKQYLIEKISQEENKKRVLFTLLDRMAELRKTEVTFEEFLYSPSQRKLATKATLKDRQSLERLILDPRPKSPYKQLLSDGIIEERSDSPGLTAKEKIRFSQEKIIDIIYPEFLKKHKKRVIIATYLMVLFIIIPVVGAFFETRNLIRNEESEINSILTVQLPDNAKITQVTELSLPVVRTVKTLTVLGDVITYTMFILLMLGNVYSSTYGRFFAAKIIKNDLPSRFIREKYTLMKQKKYPWGIILFGIIIFIFAIRNNFEFNKGQLLAGIPIFMVYTTLLNIILGAYIILKNANSPLDAFCLFGKKEVLMTLLELGIGIPLLILLIVIPIYLKSNPLFSNRLTTIKNEWVYNKEIVSIKHQDPVLFNKLSDRIFGADEVQTPHKDYTIQSIMKYFVFCLAINFALILVLQYYIGFWLYKLLKRRL